MTGDPNNDTTKSEDAVEPGDAGQPNGWEEVDSRETIDGDRWVQAHQAKYDPESNRALVTALVLAIAEAKKVNPIHEEEMPPLYESLDAAALEDTFFGPAGADTKHDHGGLVTFHHSGYKVALRADGWIFVYEPR
jgi:hypothetical protein